VLARYDREPEVGVSALLIEHLALCLNPTQGLIAGARLSDLIAATGRGELIERFNRGLEQKPHALYEVRRIKRPRGDDPTRLANASRHLRLLDEGTRPQTLRALRRRGTPDASDGIARVWLRRARERLPTVEHYLVAGPRGAIEKGDPRFDDWWQQATKGS
jgi:hypothetical protein